MNEKDRTTKTLLMAIMTSVVMTVACTQGESMRATPLGSGLESYMEVTGQNTLLGVRHSRNHEVVVTPADYTSFTVEEDVIKGRKAGDDYIWAFTLDGQPIGRFDLFSHWRHESSNYYLGTTFSQRCFYFPETGDIVNTLRLISEPEYLLYMDADSCWCFRDNKGRVLYNVPDQAIILCNHNGKDLRVVSVAVGCQQDLRVLHNERGEPTDTLSAAQWRELIAEYDEQEQTGKVTIAKRNTVSF